MTRQTLKTVFHAVTTALVLATATATPPAGDGTSASASARAADGAELPAPTQASDRR